MMVLAESLLSFKCMGVGGRVGEGGVGVKLLLGCFHVFVLCV